MKAVIYARYSPGPNQTEQSIEGQVADCEAFARANNIKIIKIYADRHVSGKSTKGRYEFLKMVADAEAGRFDAVITWKIDRLGRDRYDLAVNKYKLKRAGVRLLYAKESIPDGPEGILLESVMEGLAEYYSADLRQKVIRGRKESLKKGLAVGGSMPIGYKVVDKRIVIDVEKAELVQELFRLYCKGAKLQDCVDFLNDHGATSIRGREVSRAVVHRMLRNKRYLGIFDESGIERHVTPIIDEKTFEEAQLMHRTSRNNAAGKASEEYLLSGKCFCAYDGALLIGETGTGKSGKLYHYYKCSRRKRAKDRDLQPIPQELLEEAVINATMEDMLTDETINALVDEMMRVQDEEAKVDPAAVYREQLNGNRKRQQNLLAALEFGRTPEIVLQRLQELEEEAAELEANIRRAELERPYFARPMLVRWLESFRDGNKKDATFRRRLVDTFVARVDVSADSAAIYYNMTESSAPDKGGSDTDHSLEQTRLCSNSPVVILGNFILLKVSFTQYSTA